MSKIIKPLVTSLASIAIASTLFMFSLPSESTIDSNRASVEHLRDLMLKNTELNADMAQIRQGSVKHYDTLEDRLGKINLILDQLKHGDNKIYHLGNDEVDQGLDDLTSIFSYKGGYITTFKLHHSLMHNSLDYLPGALDRLYANELKNDKDEILHRRIEDAFRFTLMYTISGDDKWRRNALAHTKWLRDEALEKSRKIKVALQSLADHMDVVVNSSEKIAELVDSINDNTTSTVEAALYTNYIDRYEEQQKQMPPYLLALYLLTIILSLGIALRSLFKKG